MRLSILAVVGALGCGGSDRGAVLTVSSLGDPMTATRIEIVLASADPQFISTVEDQRSSPAKLDETAVIYYRQRAAGGIVATNGQLDAFAVRIEPDATMAPDESFIPFVLAYDNDTLVGIGSVDDAAGEPSPVVIRDGIIVKYTVTMQPLKPASPTAAIARGETTIVRCVDRAQLPWLSGIAWQGALGIQRRLLLPDLGQDATATDATGRESDLDCDSHAAGDDDCDDLRETYHQGGTETCDGLDTNCDGARFEVLDCALSTASCGGRPGVQVCDELNPASSANCTPDPACRCRDVAGTNCRRCVLDFATTSDPMKQTPCEPAVGLFTLEGCTSVVPCSVEVVGTTTGWHAQVGAIETGPFETKVAGIHGQVALLVKRGGDVDGAAAASVGTVQLVVTAGPQITAVGVDLELGLAPAACTSIGNGGGSQKMVCTP